MHETTAPAETMDTAEATAVADTGRASQPAALEPLPPPGPHQQPVTPPVPYPASYQPWASPVPQTTSRPGLVLGVISLITSGLALLGVIGLLIWTFAGPSAGLPPADEFGPPPAPLTGQLPSAPNGRLVSSADLTQEIAQRLEDDGWVVAELACPQVTGLGPGTVSVCHGTMDDDSEWAVIVFFEDAKGSYTLSLV